MLKHHLNIWKRATYGDESYLINTKFEINKSNLIAFETNKNLTKILQTTTI